ncbi:hypothetical protein DMH27_00015 [Raoultella planticola]|nr:hypothetical protein [Raoultella planticola]
MEDKSSVSRAANFHARKCHFIRVSEIYAWCGQTPCVMSVAAVRQRASHVPWGYSMSYTGKNRMDSGSEGSESEQE